MEKTKGMTLGIGKIILVILGCVLMPVLIFVALGAAIYQETHAKETRTETVPTFGQVLAATGLRRR